MNIRMLITKSVNADGLNVDIDDVVTMDIEEYLKCVVPNEMSDYYPSEALKAQVIIVAAFLYQLSHTSVLFLTHDRYTCYIQALSQRTERMKKMNKKQCWVNERLGVGNVCIQIFHGFFNSFIMQQGSFCRKMFMSTRIRSMAQWIRR